MNLTEGIILKLFRCAMLATLLICFLSTHWEEGRWEINTAAAGDQPDDNEVKTVTWPSIFGDPPAGQPRVKRYRRRARRPTTTAPYESGVRPARLTGRESCRKIMSHSQKQAPIYNDFMTYFNKCAPGCRPNKVYGMWGCRASGRSCHHTGEAVDIGGFICGRRQVSAGSRAFQTFVNCMVEKGKFRKLYKCKDHWDHAHFSRGCWQRRI